MDSRLLRFFVTVYEEKNLTRAAKRNFVSQPNVSNGIKDLEYQLGVVLFHRSKKGVVPTAEGHQLYPRAKRLVTELNDLSQQFKTLDFTCEITIGIASGLAQEQKQQFFRQSNAVLGSVQWEVGEIHRDRDLNLLVREWKFEGTLFQPLWKEAYVLCIPEGHALLKKDAIALQDLIGEPFIHCPPCEAHQQCLSLLNAQGEAPKTVANCHSKEEVLSLLMAGVGLTFLPEGLIDGWYGFEVRPFEGPVYHREVGIGYHRKSLQNPEIERLLQQFAKVGFSTRTFQELGGRYS
ncbi:LysR-type transcriptional regulator [Tenacibaculum litopenaei]|uniref:LysR family transcriptional regulator n=1 Tax=Tenacibaculum litopenaei TaxID=396016 RepID=UPI0038951FBF